MKRLVLSFLLVSLTVCGGLTSASAQVAHELVTVELFTSQGCSSCPTADDILNELADRPDVLALTLPVDYWDYLGWRDTQARPENAQRQYAYAKALKTYQPYTPQIVVDGRTDVVGNNKSKVLKAVEDHLKQVGSLVPISFEPNARSVSVVVGESRKADAATVWLVRFLNAASVHVDRGENEGRQLSYRHVVKSMSPIGMWSGAPVRFDLSRADLLGDRSDSERGLAIIVQRENAGAILGSALMPVLP